MAGQRGVSTDTVPAAYVNLNIRYKSLSSTHLIFPATFDKLVSETADASCDSKMV